MKRFLVFAGDYYYPSGAFGDFRKDFDTLEEAQNYLIGRDFDWHEIVDTKDCLTYHKNKKSEKWESNPIQRHE